MSKSYFRRRWLASCRDMLKQTNVYLRSPAPTNYESMRIVTEVRNLNRRYLDNSATTNRPGGL